MEEVEEVGQGSYEGWREIKDDEMGCHLVDETTGKKVDDLDWKVRFQIGGKMMIEMAWKMWQLVGQAEWVRMGQNWKRQDQAVKRSLTEMMLGLV